MAEYLIQDTTLGAIADAINAKTGGSSAMTPAEMVTEIGNIQTGGGGSLPSSISKIDGGSFTLASDTKCSSLDIATALNTPAKGFVIWCDELLDFETVSNKALVMASVYLRNYESASGTDRYGGYAYLQRQTSGSTFSAIVTLSYANQPDRFAGNNKINYYVTDTYYLADKTYYWLAWA